MSKTVPTYLQALGKRSPPQSVVAEGETCALRHLYKNDFFALTARYDGPTRSAVLKVNRQASFWGFPLRWVGRWLARREARAYRRLEGVEGIPRFLGPWEDTGILHDYVPGQTLRDHGRVSDEFHDQLERLIQAVHERGMAYVDLEKPENVLVDARGRPFLVDFQICWFWPFSWGSRSFVAKGLLRLFQDADRYHLLKLKHRTRPDLMSQEERHASLRRPWYIATHRVLTRPLTRLRRALLNRIDPRRRGHERGRVDQPITKGTTHS